MENYFYGFYDGRFLKTHINECIKQFSPDQVVMVSLVGSQNYNLDTRTSDYDSKCCILPSWKDIILAHQPYSHTHILENGEHIDFTDFREMMKILKKQNINFLEQLFSSQYYVNEIYGNEIEQLRNHREEIAHYNPCKCVQTMAGIAKSKESRIFRKLSEEKNADFDKYGYHPKELMQLMRIEEFLKRYIDGVPFEQCLRTEQRNELLRIKTGLFTKGVAERYTEESVAHVKEMEKSFLASHEIFACPAIDVLMEEATESIFKKYLKKYI